MKSNFGVEYSDDGKTLIKCPEDFVGEYVIPEGVTEIGEYAFHYCRNLTSIVIPNSVTEIGEHAFDFCDSLTSIVIPNSVTEIGEGAFAFCDSLTSIVMPNSVVEIGDCALEECENLTSIDSAIELEDRVFEDCGYIPGEEF